VVGQIWLLTAVSDAEGLENTLLAGYRDTDARIVDVEL